MKVFILLILFSTSSWAVPTKLLREICPFCENQTDGTLLMPNGLDNYYKMKVTEFTQERISVSFLAETDLSGKPLTKVMTFKSQISRENFASGLKGMCANFLEFKYYSSGLVFHQGSYRSGPGEMTKATFHLSCRKKTSMLKRFFSFLDKKTDRDRSHVFDDLRYSGKEIPIRTYKVQESRVRVR